MNALKSRSGFTLIELMMAMLAGVVLAVTVFAMLISQHRALENNSQSLKMQRDASLALAMIGREIRQSRIEDILIDGVRFTEDPYAAGSRLDFDAAVTRTNPVSVYVSGNQLLAETPAITLVEDWLTGFTVDFTEGPAVDVALRLDAGNRVGQLLIRGTFVPRN
ncbi:PilW family protein [Pontiella agarivorans]|uniref:Prepilin-type N-terminal cleavage/methylation domain-containing protein n=1 Tax=Pontiella agarivorans TaxID=3038953 RepID=A0ABU5MYL8_9BACT|nr:prepilin-type N-terminal cleavage/methylation domain-containing protein [Pontiella agarivorans]MDZ8119288.1 prepilin-type N-terminal cleavage/methylation domain-containing protein [Pontiella agarivorans]